MTPFFDSHAHLTHEKIDDDMLEAMLSRALKAGVTEIINICTDTLSLKRGIQLHAKHPWIYNAAATTPHDVDKEGEKIFPFMEKHAREGHLAAIGETGLDYHYNHSLPETQKHFLKRYLHLAVECSLPVIIHCRDAFDDLFTILDATYPKSSPGILHCFTGNSQEAKEVIDRNWYLSLSGIVTFKRSEELREIAKLVPLNQLLIETDTPYLAPQSKRGKPNEPAYLPETAQMIADIKELSLEELTKQTRLNTQRFLQGQSPS